MADKSQLNELLDKLYEVSSFAAQIHFRIEVEMQNLIEIVEDELETM